MKTTVYDSLIDILNFIYYLTTFNHDVIIGVGKSNIFKEHVIITVKNRMCSQCRYLLILQPFE